MTPGLRAFKNPYFRERSQGSWTGGLREYHETTFAGAMVNQSFTEHDSMKSGGVQTTTDVVTPGYRQRIARGDVINHAFWSKKTERSTGYSGYKVRRNTGSGSTVQFFESPAWYTEPPELHEESRPSNSPLSTLAVEAGVGAGREVNNTDLQSLVELAEAHKAKDALRFRLGDFNKYLAAAERAAKRKGLRELTGLTVKALADVMSNNWLRARYGLGPMMYTIEDAVKNEKIRLTRATARGGAQWSSSGVWDGQKTASFFTDDWHITETYEVSCRAGILYRPDWDMNRYGLSLHRIPEAVWESTRLSFVADWWLNIGDYIAANSATIGVKKLATWTSFHEVYTKDLRVVSTWKAPNGFSMVQACTGGNSLRVETISRNPGVRSGIVLKRSSVKEATRDKRIIDAFALANSTFWRLMRMG
jgi:hypothetical protein